MNKASRPNHKFDFHVAVKPFFGRRGFTLVEVFVVIGIIAILAVLLFPMARKAIESANAAKCTSNLRQFGVAIVSYAAENHMDLPSYRMKYAENGFANWFEQGSAQQYPVVGWAWNYIDPQRKLFRCPSDRTASPRDKLKNPSAAYCSYAANYSFMTMRGADGQTDNGWAVSKLYNVQNKMLLCDGVSHLEDSSQGDLSAATAVTVNNASTAISSRHRGGANFLLGDGSVRWVKYSDAIDTSVSAYLANPDPYGKKR